MIDKTEYRLAFGHDINLGTANNLRARICDILDRRDFGSLVLLFSSEGGNTDHALSLYNFISELPIPVRMHAVGHIGSAAVPVFLAGNTRTSSPLARFFFHEYHWVFNEGQTLKRIDEAAKRLRNDIKFSRDIIEARAQVPAKIIEALDGRSSAAVLSPTEAKAYGLIEDVCNLRKSGYNGLNVAVWSS